MNPMPDLSCPLKWSSSTTSIVCGSLTQAESAWGSMKKANTFAGGTGMVKVPSSSMTHLDSRGLRDSLTLEDPPNLPLGDRDVDVRNPKMGQCVDDRVRNGGGRADGRGLADSFRPDRVGRGGRRGLRGLPL